MSSVESVSVNVIDPADEASVHRHWEIEVAATRASRSHDFTQSWEQRWLVTREPRSDMDVVLLGASVDGEMWGAGQVAVSLRDNLSLAGIDVFVDPPRQREGIGSALAEGTFEEARRRGRTKAHAEAYAPIDKSSPGLDFALNLGFVAGLEDGIKVVDLAATEASWDALAEKVAPRHRDYTIVTWQDRVPEELIPGLCALNESFFEQAPMGDLEMENEVWDAARVHERDDRHERVGRWGCAAGAVSAAGELVGLTEVWISRLTPTHGFQSGTIVSPEHRGHGLGMAIKIANHRQIRERVPECARLLTGNADVNAPMNAVNDALGYSQVERMVELQRPL